MMRYLHLNDGSKVELPDDADSAYLFRVANAAADHGYTTRDDKGQPVAHVGLSDGSLLEIPEGMDAKTLQNVLSRADSYVADEADKDRMRKGYGDAAMNAGSAFMSGLNKGAVADTLGAPVDAVNWGLRKLGLPVSDKPFMGSGWLTDKMTDAHMVQPTRGWDKTEHFGELVGSGLGMAATGGAVAPLAEGAGMMRTAGVANALGPNETLAGTLASQTAGASLQMAGESVGNAMGGAPGAAIGGMLAPMAPGLALKAAGEPLARAMFARPGGASGEAFDTLKANGITPTPGLVGNKAMSSMENFAGNVPGVGWLGQDHVGDGFKGFEARTLGLGDQLAGRDYGVTTHAPDVSSVGDSLQQAASEGLNKTRTRLSNERESILQAFGPQTLIPVQDAVPKISALGSTVFDGQVRPRTSPDLQANIGDELSRLNQVRVAASPLAEGLLKTDLNARQDMLDANPRMRPSMADALRQEAEAIRGRIEANRQVPAEALDDVINGVGKDAQGLPSLETGQAKQIKGALNDARQAAYDAKDPALGARLRASNAEYARLHAEEGPRADGGDIPYLRQLSDMAYGDKAFRDMTAGAWEKPDIVRRNNPEAWGALSGDVIAAKGSATPGNKSRSEAGVEVSPAAFASWWGGLSPMGRMVYANGDADVLNKLNSLHDAAKLFVQRGATANHSNTAPSAMAGGFMGGALFHPLTAIKSAGSAALAAALARHPGVAAILAKRNPGLAQSLAPAGLRSVGRELVGPGVGAGGGY
jgi:hypothetical protein